MWRQRAEMAESLLLKERPLGEVDEDTIYVVNGGRIAQRKFKFLWIHFDRFLSRRAIDSDKWWAMQLLSVACLSLAAKMEEYRVPSPSEFQLECDFESKVIQRMELLILNTLKWRMSSVAPFAFIHYFIRTLGNHQSPPRNVVSRTVHLILAIMRGKF
ncbi:hypothetical protein CsSME_00053865 [Camellia sinensis var. sinensis]